MELSKKDIELLREAIYTQLRCEFDKEVRQRLIKLDKLLKAQ